MKTTMLDPPLPRGATDVDTDAAGDTGSRSGEVLDGRYPGGKGLAGLWQWIIGQIQPHSVYVEPFAGRAAIARRKTPAMATYFVDTDQAVCEWLRAIRYPGSIIVNGDGTRFLEQAAELGMIDEDSLVYCDPPYVLSTRTKKRIYKNEMTNRDHGKLLAVIRALPCSVMISGYWSELYAAELRDWHANKRAVITRGGVMRDEWLWCNFDPVDRCSSSLAVGYHDMGGDYRERERVARKVRRWQRNLSKMPPRERDAIVRGLIDAEAALIAKTNDSRSTIASRGGDS